MSRKHRAAFAAKRHQPADLPKFWRPKLTEAQRTDAQIIHWDLIARFTDGSATAEDVMALARTVRDGVRDVFGITLTPEPVLVGCRL